MNNYDIHVQCLGYHTPIYFPHRHTQQAGPLCCSLVNSHAHHE